jgi:hypothetical protein
MTLAGIQPHAGATCLTLILAFVGATTFPLWNQRRIENVPAVGLVANLQTALDLVFGGKLCEAGQEVFDQCNFLSLFVFAKVSKVLDERGFHQNDVHTSL